MNIKAKLSIGFLVLIVFLCAVAGIGTMVLAENFNRMNNLVNNEYQKIELMSDIGYEFNTMVKAGTALLTVESESEQNEAIEEIQGAELRANAAIETMKGLIRTEGGRESLAAINLHLNDYTNLIDNEISLIQEGNTQEAVDLMRTEGNAIEEDFFAVASRIVDFNEKNMASTLLDTESENRQTTFILIILSVIGVIAGIIIAVWITRSIVTGLDRVSGVMEDFSSGKSNLSTRIEVIEKDEIGSVAASFNRMAETIGQQVEREQQISKQNEEQAWMMQKLADLTAFLQESKNLESFSQKFIQEMTPIVQGTYGVFYLNGQEDSEPLFNLTASYAYKKQPGAFQAFKLGEGLVGQCGLDKKAVLLTEVPDDYVRISSGTGEAAPAYLFIVPIVFEKKVRAVFEIASFHPFSPIEQELILKLADYSGIIIDNIAGRIKMMDLLQESQTMTEELQAQSEELSAQHEELKRFNHELEEQTQALIHSEQALQQQQEELEQANAELEEKAVMLEEHNQMFEIKNKEVELAKVELEEKAVQLELTSKYKSEFLANMSHELRTPLNSLLILSRLLADNKTKNLSEKQVEFAETINSAGCDLLDLINEILDLAKVESGKIDLELKEVEIQEIIDFVQRNFYPIAQDKGIELRITIEKDVGEIIHTDEKRIQQILKNLLANAFKFTHSGHVELNISRVAAKEKEKNGENAEEVQLAFAVSDTGIGIIQDKQSIIFEAFQQADGTTSRKYGGTGLGLSISREHAAALNGQVKVESEEGIGSTFTLVLPARQLQPLQESYLETAVAQGAGAGNLSEGQTALQTKQPEPDVLVDIPKEIFASQVADAVTAENNFSDESLGLSATNEVFFADKKILIVDDDIRNVYALSNILEGYDMDILFAENGREALEVLSENQDIDMVLMDIMMPEMDGYEAITKIREMDQHKELPIIALTAKAMKEDREKCIAVGASDYISKPIINDQLLSLMRVWLYR